MKANSITIRNLTDHVIIVVDESSSMGVHRNKLVQQVDGLIKHLAVRSQELDRETRVSIWVFSNHSRVRCLVWDKDVLRLPSIAEFYNPNGLTALIDGTMDALNAHLEIPTVYGEHAFLAYVLTDGQENDSLRYGPPELRWKLGQLPDNWTVAALVPDRRGAEYAKQCGFKAGNVETWDATSAAGIDDAAVLIKRSTDNWQTARSTGVKSTSSLFSTGADAVNKRTVGALTPLTKGSFVLHPIGIGEPRKIKDYVEGVLHMPYVIGNAYYQFHKTETIQVSKDLAVVSKNDGKVYVGKAVRSMIGLDSGVDVRVKPDFNPDYDIFVKSTSTNRSMIPGTKVLVLR